MKNEELFREEIPRPYSSFINELEERIRFLEQCLDNKEKVNISLREELEKLKSTYVYDAKQVRDIC